MIAALVDLSRTAQDKFSFRDRDLLYWLAHFYPFCTFFASAHRETDFDFVFVFSLNIFPVPAPSAGRELRRWLQKQDRLEPWLAAPKDMPFFVASKAFLKKKN